jgi:exo-beta-1,3-glucanase (GH17 family)
VAEARTIGINYGRLGNNLPTASDTVQLIRDLGIGRVRIFDHDGPTIKAFAGSGLEFIIGMGNDEITPLGVDASAADAWVAANVVPYYPATNIVYVLVGNEPFADTNNSAMWLQVVPAIQNLYASLQSRNLTSIRVSTAAEYSILAVSYPPSKGVFQTDVATQVIMPLLKFLDSTHAHLFINVYPYFSWEESSQYVPLDYALFTRSTALTTDGKFQYTNLLDAQLDAVAAAVTALGYGNVRIAISETGWPTCGDSNEIGANITNAETFNQNLVNHILSSPTVGTPVRPGIFVPTFIFALFNENEKPGPTTERNWGILFPNGKPVYPLDIKDVSAATPPGSSPGGGGGGGTVGLNGLNGNTCHGKPSELPRGASFFGTIFNLRI